MVETINSNDCHQLIHSVAIFIKYTDQVLGSDILRFITAYVDDIVITSSNVEEYCERVEKVLHRLSENNITLKLDKSKLIAVEVNDFFLLM